MTNKNWNFIFSFFFFFAAVFLGNCGTSDDGQVVDASTTADSGNNKEAAPTPAPDASTGDHHVATEGGGACIASVEVCDGRDNDCDNQVDEDGVCSGNPTPSPVPSPTPTPTPTPSPSPTPACTPEGVKRGECWIGSSKGIETCVNGKFECKELFVPDAGTAPSCFPEGVKDGPCTVNGCTGTRTCRNGQFQCEPPFVCPDGGAPEVQPNAPALLIPADGELMDNGRTDKCDYRLWVFDWSDVTGVSRYEIQISNATQLVVDQIITTSTFTLKTTDVVANAQRLNWSWHVRAGFSNGTWTAYTPSRQFDVQVVDSDTIDPSLCTTGTGGSGGTGGTGGSGGTGGTGGSAGTGTTCSPDGVYYPCNDVCSGGVRLCSSGHLGDCSCPGSGTGGSGGSGSANVDATPMTDTSRVRVTLTGDLLGGGVLFDSASSATPTMMCLVGDSMGWNSRSYCRTWGSLFAVDNVPRFWSGKNNRINWVGVVSTGQERWLNNWAISTTGYCEVVPVDNLRLK